MLGRLRSLSAQRVDAAIAAAVLVGGVLEALVVPVHGRRWVAVLTVVIQAGALAFRRRYPLVAPLVVLTSFTVALRLGLDSNDLVVTVVVILIAMYTLGSQRSTNAAMAGLGISLVVVAVAVSASPRSVTSDFAYAFLMIGVPWAVGRVIRERSRRISRLETEQEAQARRAVTEERGRIARELHDVVAHCVGVMVVQAQASERMLDSRPDRSRDALRQIQVTGREALEEMHRLVGILRESPDSGTAPQGRLRHLDALLDQTRDAGLPVDVTVDGDVQDLPPGVDLAAYRIIQEALTNSLKHAAGGRARVHVERSTRELRVSIVDEGGGGNGKAPGSGHGLIGMRERASLYGGQLTTGTSPEGGFAVTASLPLR